MRILLRQLGVILLGSLVASCAPSNTSSNSTLGGTNIKASSDLSATERSAMESDLKRIGEMQFSGFANTNAGKRFSQIFGGSSAASVVNFLNQRVTYIVSARFDYKSNLGIFRKEVQDSKPLDVASIAGRVDAIERASERSSSRTQSTTVAQNLGFDMLYQTIANVWQGTATANEIYLKIDGDKVAANSTRAGVMQLGEGFSLDDADKIFRITTYIHEARHSDCTGGLSHTNQNTIATAQHAADLDSLFPSDASIAAGTEVCAHIHSLCPDTLPGGAPHPYKKVLDSSTGDYGPYACDKTYFGAYMVEGVYSQAVFANCTNCTEAEVSEADAIITDANTKQSYRANFGGVTGDTVYNNVINSSVTPNMSHTDVVITK